MWKITPLNTKENWKKPLEMEIAKKNYEIELIRIQLKYGDDEPENRRIWFLTN